MTSSANGGSVVDATKAVTDDVPAAGDTRVRLPAERYETLEVLGQGAMGIVYKARDRALDRVVAIKTIHPDQAALGSDFSGITERLYQEATAAARLNHPGIVTVYDVTLTAGVPYVVMEYFKGRTLSDLLSEGALTPQKAGHVILQVCRALEYAHAQGVIHRDVKSSNIMVDAGWRVKLADFGVARVVDKQSTRTGVMIGTPAYMSPEQAQGAAADARSDLFSLGVVLYETLTGQKPFPGEDVVKVLDEVLHLDPIPARERNFAVSPALDAVVRRVMSKEPQDRYPDAAAFADALSQALPPDVPILNLIGRTDLRLLIGVLARCRAFVSNDSGAMHLAAAAGVPVTAIFGPTNERATAPLGEHDVLLEPVFCRPCMLRECPIDHRCMKRISPDAVFASVARRL